MKTELESTNRPKYVRDADLPNYLPMGLCKARELSQRAGARFKVDDVALNDLDKLFDYIASFNND